MILSFFSNEPPLARRLGAQPLHAIHTFPDATVGRIVGKAAHLAPDDENAERQFAPLTGRPCAAWFVRITGAHLNKKGATPVLEAGAAVPFTVSDDTGQAIIHARDASLLLAFDVTEMLGFSRTPPPRIQRFLREHERGGLRVPIDWRLSWQEGIVAEGQRVAIVGRGRRETDPEAARGSYRRAATRLVMTRGGEGEELFVSTFAGALGGRITARQGV